MSYQRIQISIVSTWADKIFDYEGEDTSQMILTLKKNMLWYNYYEYLRVTHPFFIAIIIFVIASMLLIITAILLVITVINRNNKSQWPITIHSSLIFFKFGMTGCIIIKCI